MNKLIFKGGAAEPLLNQLLNKGGTAFVIDAVSPLKIVDTPSPMRGWN